MDFFIFFNAAKQFPEQCGATALKLIYRNRNEGAGCSPRALLGFTGLSWQMPATDVSVSAAIVSGLKPRICHISVRTVRNSTHFPRSPSWSVGRSTFLFVLRHACWKGLLLLLFSAHISLGSGPRISGNDGYCVCHDAFEAKPRSPAELTDT